LIGLRENICQNALTFSIGFKGHFTKIDCNLILVGSLFLFRSRKDKEEVNCGFRNQSHARQMTMQTFALYVLIRGQWVGYVIYMARNKLTQGIYNFNLK